MRDHECVLNVLDDNCEWYYIISLGRCFIKFKEICFEEYNMADIVSQTLFKLVMLVLEMDQL